MRRPGYWHDYYAKNKERVNGVQAAYKARKREKLLDAVCTKCRPKLEKLLYKT